MSDPGDAARPRPPRLATGGLFPARVLRDLREVSGADLVTVYLSEPSSPFVRSSYQLLVADGAEVDRLPQLRGPLTPTAVALFSVTDLQPTLLVPDVRTVTPWSQSSFARRHGVQSLVRLSVRTTGFERVSRIVLMPTLLEVFLSFRDPRTGQELSDVAAAARELLERERSAIAKCAPLLKLLNPRSTAAKYRRLDAIAIDFAAGANLPAARPAQRQSVQRTFEQMAQFVVDSCGLPARGHAVAWHVPYRWGGGRPRPGLVHRFGRVPEGFEVTDLFRPIASWVARARASVVVGPDDAPRWQRLVLAKRDLPFLFSIPLFAGTRLLGVMSVASERQPQSLPSLWRMVPLMERLLGDCLAHEAIEDAIDGRTATHWLATMPMVPREAALGERLRYLSGHLRADASLIVAPDALDAEATVWRRRDDRRQVRIPPDGVRGPAEFFRRHPAQRVVLVELRNRGGRGFGAAYSVHADAQERPVVQSAIDVALLDQFLLLGRAAAGDEGRPFLVAVMPLWPPKADREDRTVRGLVVVAWTKVRLSLRPGLVVQLDALARTLAAATISIERAAQRAALIAWASAGVGPIHQLIKVVEDCRQAVLASENGDLRERIEVFYEQLWILHQFSRPVTRADTAELEHITFDEVVATAVRRAMLLTGETEPPVLHVDVADRRILVGATDRTALHAVLSCAISNSVRYGIGFAHVRARYDVARAEFELVVENEAEETELALSHLDEARRIAAKVAAGEMDTTFLHLVETVEHRGLRGIGTWLAARVTKELLGGSYSLEYAVVAGGKVEVRATIRFSERVGGDPGLAAGIEDAVDSIG